MKNKSRNACKILILPFLIGIILVSFKSIYAEAPVATIISPQHNDTFPKMSSITFLGSGTDAEDGNLSGDQLVWVSDGDGPLGNGDEISTYLSGGAHTIMLTVTDSTGASSSTQITIIVR